jgi:uncharacterized protein (TIGR02001 family)
VALGGLRASLLAGAALLIAGPAFAADLSGGSLKDAPAAADSWTATGYIQGTNDYIFRGLSQTRRDPAIQGGADIGYGWFYAGTFLSNVDFKYPVGAVNEARAEFDLYAGIKPKVGDVTLDLGVITYNYAWNKSALTNIDPSYQELKAGASVTVLKDLTVGGTFYWSPDYFGQVGQAITVEGTASKPVAKIQDVDIAVSGTIGHVTFANTGPAYASNVDYTYGNLGVTGTYKSISLDLRWWDSDYPKALSSDLGVYQSGNAFAGTLKYSF